MLLYYLKCRKNTESKNVKIVKTKNRRITLLSKCDSKKLKLIREQEARGILSKLTEIKIPILSDSPIANILF